MFYQQTLRALRGDLARTQERRDTYYGYWQSQSARANQLSKELDQALESITGYENQVESLNSELARFHEVNAALADTNRDLSQRLELLQDVLKQLQIPVKLPAPRKRG